MKEYIVDYGVFQEAFRQLRMMDFCIIQHYDSLSMRILRKYIFQKLKKYFRIIFPVLFHINTACFIVRTTNQFYAFLLSISRYDPLLPFWEPGFHDRLIISDHGFVFKQDCADVIVQQFFNVSKFSLNCSCFPGYPSR